MIETYMIWNWFDVFFSTSLLEKHNWSLGDHHHQWNHQPSDLLENHGISCMEDRSSLTRLSLIQKIWSSLACYRIQATMMYCICVFGGLDWEPLKTNLSISNMIVTQGPQSQNGGAGRDHLCTLSSLPSLAVNGGSVKPLSFINRRWN